jgi:hypothetical protein
VIIPWYINNWATPLLCFAWPSHRRGRCTACQIIPTDHTSNEATTTGTRTTGSHRRRTETAFPAPAQVSQSGLLITSKPALLRDPFTRQLSTPRDPFPVDLNSTTHNWDNSSSSSRRVNRSKSYFTFEIAERIVLALALKINTSSGVNNSLYASPGSTTSILASTSSTS